MSLPSREGVLNRTAADPDVPSGLRIQALNQLPKPWRVTLVRTMHCQKASAKLKAIASIRYAALVEQEAKKKASSMKPEQKQISDSHNCLGLKN